MQPYAVFLVIFIRMNTETLRKKEISRLLALIFAVSLPLFAFALTPQEALEKSRQKLASATSVQATFSMKAEGQNIKGKLISKGSKFSLVSSASSNWYNGKELYTYVPSQKETTVFKPTSTEIAEVNPLMYINSGSQFNITGTKTKKNGLETIVLIPKKNGTGVKNIIIDIDSKTYLPKSIKLTMAAGGAVDVTISDITLNSPIKDSTFEYPKDKYKNVKLIDMR